MTVAAVGFGVLSFTKDSGDEAAVAQELEQQYSRGGTFHHECRQSSRLLHSLGDEVGLAVGVGGPGGSELGRQTALSKALRSVQSPGLPDTWSMPTGSLDRWPDDYERGRPGWPPEVVALAGVPSTATVLDLGAGTGKLTRLLIPAFHRVIAVEPAEEMRRLLERICPGAESLPGAGQDIPLPDTSVDAVFAAQSFHWFEGQRAVGEIARVLRSEGTLVLMWNLPKGPWEPSAEGAEELLLSRAPSASHVSYDPLDLGKGVRVSSDEWALAGSSFEPLQSALLPNPQTLDRDGLVTYYASMGWLADLPDEERLPLLERVRSLLLAPEYHRLWDTHVHWTRRAA